MTRENRLAVALEAARNAGSWLEESLWLDHSVRTKGPYDLSLSADEQASQIIGRVLKRNFPEEPILEEDRKMPEENPDFVWIVDPLDGTVNYFHRLPWYCVSISCYQRDEPARHPLWRWGRPIVSVVYAPSLNQEFHAVAGSGAWCGSRRLAVTDEELGKSILAYSRGSRIEDQNAVRCFLAAVGSDARKTRSHGAAALDLAYVAQGSLGVLAQRSLQPWDVAAGVHLVLEAGGDAELTPAQNGGHHVLAGSSQILDRLTGSWSSENEST